MRESAANAASAYRVSLGDASALQRHSRGWHPPGGLQDHDDCRSTGPVANLVYGVFVKGGMAPESAEAVVKLALENGLTFEGGSVFEWEGGELKTAPW